MQKAPLPDSHINSNNGNVVKRTRRRRLLVPSTLTLAPLMVLLLIGTIAADEQPERQMGGPSKEVADKQRSVNKSWLPLLFDIMVDLFSFYVQAMTFVEDFG